MAEFPSKYRISVTPFDAFRLKAASCVWFDEHSDLALCNKNNSRQKSLEEIAHRFGYAIPSSPILRRKNFDLTDRVRMHAEAYGVQHNGGGARAGNFEGIQLKGLGCNVYLGENTDERHNYGILYFDQAVAELIQSKLCQAILPHGAVNVFGIISTGIEVNFADFRPSAWNSAKPASILLREPCMRPAHFMRARGFQPRRKRPSILPDAIRVATVQRGLANLAPDNEGFEKLIFYFIVRSARQFAVARANRLMHGAFTASNICLDGRWLDVPSASVIKSGTNPKLGKLNFSFQEESFNAVQIARELVYTYNKFNLSNVDFSQFSSQYRHIWSESYFEEILTLIGISEKKASCSHSFKIKLARFAASIIDGKQNVLLNFHYFEVQDLFQKLLIFLYSPLIVDKPDSSLNEYQQALCVILTEQYEIEQQNYHSWTVFVRSRFLSAYRRCSFLKFFENQNVYNVVRHRNWGNIEQNFSFMDHIKKIINVSLDLSNSNETIIYEFSGNILKYEHMDGTFKLISSKSGLQTYSNCAQLIACLDAMPIQHFEFEGFNFLPSIRTGILSLAQ